MGVLFEVHPPWDYGTSVDVGVSDSVTDHISSTNYL